MVDLIDEIKQKFQQWYLIQRNKYLQKQIALLPSENQEDYYFDNLTNQFVYKDSTTVVQIGLENILNVVKTRIETVAISTEKLEAIIDDIAQVNIDTTSLTAIISDIATVNANITNLQATIADIANIEANIINLQAIISDIANVNVNVVNLQAIISNISNVDANITNLQAIIANIATMTVDTSSLTAIIANISNLNINSNSLQAIISDIANIEAQIIAIQTTTLTMNTAIASINTAITNIETTNADIDININSIEALDIDISEQVNKAITISGTQAINTSSLIGTINSDYLYNAISIIMKANDSNPTDFWITLKTSDDVEFLEFNTKDNRVRYFNDYYFPSTKYIKIYLWNKSTTATINYNLEFYYTNQTRLNNFSNKCQLDNSSFQAYYITDITLLNRLSYVFYATTSMQTYWIKVYTKLHNSAGTYWAMILEENISGAVSTVLNGILSFTDTSMIKVEVYNSENQLAYLELNVFFSKNLKPELDEHSSDSTIHFLESAIDHNNILNKGSNIHSVIDTHLANTLKHYLVGSILHSAINDDQASKHRLINDSGSGATELFSASKIIADLLLKAGVVHNHTGVYEPVFSKNTGFNLNLGVSGGQVSEGNHGHIGYYTQAEVNAFLHIGTGNKGEIDLGLETSYISEYVRIGNQATYYNRDGSDFQMHFSPKLPLQLADGKKLYVDYIYVALFDADGNDYLNNLQVIGWSSYASSTSLFNSTVNHTTVGLKSYYTGIDIWGNYKRIDVNVNVVATTGAEFETPYVSMRYWYA